MPESLSWNQAAGQEPGNEPLMAGPVGPTAAVKPDFVVKTADITKLDRRAFIQVCAVLGTSLVVGLDLQACSANTGKGSERLHKGADDLQVNA